MENKKPVSDAELHRMYRLKCKEKGLKPGNDAYRLLGTPRTYSPLSTISAPVGMDDATVSFDDLPDDAVIQMTKGRLVQLHADILRECGGLGEKI